jgi:hypothetical protein
MPPYHSIVEKGQEPVCTVAAPGGDDDVDTLIPKERVKIIGPLLVRAGKIAALSVKIWGKLYTVSLPLEIPYALIEGVW